MVLLKENFNILRILVFGVGISLSIIMIIIGNNNCINTYSTGNCPNSCVKKTCSQYIIYYDSEGGRYEGYDEGPCSCEKINSDNSKNNIM